ncbi:CYP704B1, partial [Symbiodinium sp. CCMP2456]
GARDLADAGGDLARLRGKLRRNCPSRQELLLLRRDLMFWWDRHRFHSKWEKLRTAFDGTVQAVELCRKLQRPRAVVQLHIPKTAGSAMKEWAETAGFRVLDQTQQIKQGDGPYWIGTAGIPGSCRQRVRENRDRNTTWVAVERWLDLPLCDDFQYVVALREPVMRTLHQFSHKLSYFRDFLPSGRLPWYEQIENLEGQLRSLWTYEELGHLLRGRRRSRLLLGKELSANRSLSSERWPVDWLELWMGMSSNYQVRSLAGKGGGAAYLERGELAARRLAAAKRVLAEFDVVLSVGRGGVDRSQEELLWQGLHMESRGHTARIGFPFVSHFKFGDDEPQPFRFNLVNLTWPSRLELQLRNYADRSLVKFAGQLQRLDRIYFAWVEKRVTGTESFLPMAPMVVLGLERFENKYGESPGIMSIMGACAVQASILSILSQTGPATRAAASGQGQPAS